ncbi:MAG: gliding motility-associated C-terminal domain-containing protein [Bacteroidota bacterium]
MILRVSTLITICLLFGLINCAVARQAGPIAQDEIAVVGADCNVGGSLTVKTTKPTSYSFQWRNSANEIISTENSVGNLSIGDYKLIYTPDAGATYYTLNYTIRDFSPTAATQNVTIPCGESFIRLHADNFSASSIVKYLWEDESGNTLASTEYWSSGPGQFYLTVTNQNGCVSNRASIKISPTPLRPVIYEANKVVINSSCTVPDGSITGLEVTLPEPGPVTYKWVNAAGVTVGTDKDVYNLAPGKYKLTAVQNAAACESISSEITIQLRNPITSNTTSVQTKKADCEQPNGSIKGVVTNATSYQWINTQNEVIATTLDLVDVKEGFYRLVLSNNFGCTDTIGQFHIQTGNLPIRLATQPIIKPDNCGLKIGSITGLTVPGSGIKYRWTDETGSQVSADADLRNVKSGNYYLEVSNPSCSERFDYFIPEIDFSLPIPNVGDKFVCSPTDVLISFDVQAPLYRIYDANGVLIQESISKTFTLNIKQNSTFYAAVANGACESAQTPFKVTVGEASINIPNSFTPNGDGVNDKWTLNGIEVYNSANVKVFNRYGNIVYESFKTTESFEGKSQGKELPAGVYYYMIKLTGDCNPLTGSVIIIR